MLASLVVTAFLLVAPRRASRTASSCSPTTSRASRPACCRRRSSVNGAIQETTTSSIAACARTPGATPSCTSTRGPPATKGSEPYLEQHLINDDLRFAPLFVTGDPEWRDYRVEASVRPLSLAERGRAAFRYRTSRHYYRLALEDGKRLRLARATAIEAVPGQRLARDCRGAVHLRRQDVVSPGGSAEGDRLRGLVDGKALIDVRDTSCRGDRRHHRQHAGALQGFRVTRRRGAAHELRRRVKPASGS